MADNTVINAGSGGDTIATDDVAGVKYQRVKLVDGTLDGTGAIGGDATNGLDVDVTRVVPGTAATNLGKAEDAAHTSGDTGVMDLAVRRSDANSLTALAGSDDDYTPLTTDTRGVLQVIARPYSQRLRVASGGLTTATTAYSIGDQVGTIFTFAGAAKATGGTGTVRQVTVLDKADIMTDMRIHFFRSSPTLAADNAAYAISDTDMQEYIGTVVVPSLIDGANNRYNSLTSVNLGYDCAATSLFAAIETRTANTFFGAATDINLTLHLDLD